MLEMGKNWFLNLMGKNMEFSKRAFSNQFFMFFRSFIPYKATIILISNIYRIPTKHNLVEQFFSIYGIFPL